VTDDQRRVRAYEIQEELAHILAGDHEVDWSRVHGLAEELESLAKPT
jgi:hypothetical protein